MTGAIFLTVFGNLAMVISISYFRQLHTPTNFLVLSMAVTDFLLGFTIMPYSMIRSVENCWYFGLIFCKIHYSFDLMLSITSIFHLCSVAVDRFYAICYPLWYSTTMTIPVIKQLLLLCWSVPGVFAFGVVFSEAYADGIEGYATLVACSSSCPVMFNKLWGTTLFMAGFFTPGSVMVGIYGKIFAVSRKHARAINNLPENRNNQMRKDKKAAKTLGILHSPTNFLILSLATTDFLLGLVIMPYSMVRSVESCWYFGDGFCKFHTSFDMMLSLTSIFHLCSIAVDRFYAVCYPLHYMTTMTPSMIKRLLAFCWSAPALFSFSLVLSKANVSDEDIKTDLPHFSSDRHFMSIDSFANFGVL
ncbi:trace amine-associated receptor 2-like protein [Camelus ferus]|nr:trace amine-associated receptor 2-like protein [Camelus ferus]EPY80927.1 trace amine-associated receptor 2-like protein [Camelus ferus]